MKRAFIIGLMLIIAACGIKRPLVRPADIPEYERKQQEKLEKRRIDPVLVPSAPPVQAM